MTREFKQTIVCSYCGSKTTAETAFERWMRNDSGLDSRQHGLVRFDIDVLIHKYMVKVDGIGQRMIQGMMFVEVKTHLAEMTDAQQDTLGVLDQVLRNRKKNIHGDNSKRNAKAIAPVVAWSSMNKGWITVWLHGGHCLRMSGDDPVKSDWLLWDGKRIDIDALKGLLRFDIDADSLKPIDWRRRYRAAEKVIQYTLF